MLLPWILRCHQLASVTFCTGCSAFWRHKWISFIWTLSKESKATSFPAHHSGCYALRCDVNAFQRNQHPGMFCRVLKQTTSVHFISGLPPPCCFPEPWEQAFIPWCKSVSRKYHIPRCPHPGNRGQSQLPVVCNSDWNPQASGGVSATRDAVDMDGGGHFPRTYEGPQKQGKTMSSCSKECWKQSFSRGMNLSFEFLKEWGHHWHI